MRRIPLAGVVLTLLFTTASGQVATVGVFTDATGADCSIVAGESGILEVYIFVNSPVAGVTAVEFMATKPGCLNATYLGETSPFPTVIGNSQTGVAIALGGCYGLTAHVLTLTYLINGATPTCCVYPVLPSPANPDIRIVGCDESIVSGVTVESTINGDATCFCGINPPPTEPANPTPGHNHVAVDVVAQLSWESTDPQDDPLTFDVYLGTAPDPPLVAQDLPAPEYSTDILPFNTKFYWKVTVKDDKGNEVPGPEWVFTTAQWSSAQLIAPDMINYCGLITSDTVFAGITVLNSDYPIDTGGFDFVYNNSHLTYIGYSPGDLTWNWQTLTCTDFGTHIHVDGSDPVPIPAGSNGTFVQLMFLSDCCGADSAIASALCPENTTDDLRALWPVCGQFECGVYTADGDVNEDGGVTPGDALCAFNGYLGFPDPPGDGCGTAGWDVRSDVNCSGTLTPADALCIFHNWLDGSCTFCGGGIFATAKQIDPVFVSVKDISRAGDGFAVTLTVTGVRELDAFGFDIRFPAGIGGDVSVAPATLTNGFDQLALYARGKTFARVGAYASNAAPVAGTADLVKLTITPGPGSDGAVILDSFVDDLAGAEAITIDLRTAEDDSPPITSYALFQNHPNPFNPNTEIRYEIPDAAGFNRVTLSIYDVQGKRVRTLVDESQGGGMYHKRWNGRNEAGAAVSSGVYFYVLHTADQTITRKMVLLR